MWDGQILTRKGLQYEDSTRTTFVRPVYDRTGLSGEGTWDIFLHKPERLVQRCIKVGYLDEPWQGTLISQAHFQVSRSLLQTRSQGFWWSDSKNQVLHWSEPFDLMESYGNTTITLKISLASGNCSMNTLPVHWLDTTEALQQAPHHWKHSNVETRQ